MRTRLRPHDVGGYAAEASAVKVHWGNCRARGGYIHHHLPVMLEQIDRCLGGRLGRFEVHDHGLVPTVIDSCGVAAPYRDWPLAESCRVVPLGSGWSPNLAPSITPGMLYNDVMEGHAPINKGRSITATAIMHPTSFLS